MSIRIATRGSKLALWQAHHFAAMISDQLGESTPKIVPVVTDGDRIRDRPLHEVEGKALFIKEIENTLMADGADVALHCVKDYHPEIPAGFAIAAYLERESDRDLLIVRDPITDIAELPEGALVGTTSRRRIFFLKKSRPDLRFGMLRGNIDSRLRKLEAGEFDAIVLAQAGLNRLGIAPENIIVLPDEIMLPAVGQGALAVEVRAADLELVERLSRFNHPPTQICVRAERALVSGLSGDCKSAIGVNCRHVGDGRIRLRAHVGKPETLEDVAGEIVGAAGEAEQIGRALARQLLDGGAGPLLHG